MSGLLHGWTGILMGYAAVQATVLPSQVEQLPRQRSLDLSHE